MQSTYTTRQLCRGTAAHSNTSSQQSSLHWLKDHCQQVSGRWFFPQDSAPLSPPEHWVQFWAHQYKRDMDILEQVQWRIMDWSIYHTRRGQELSLKTKKFRGDIIKVYKDLMRGCKEDWNRVFSAVSNERTRNKGHKLHYRKFHLNIRKRVFFLWWRWSKIGSEYLKRLAVSIGRGIQHRTEHGPE